MSAAIDVRCCADRDSFERLRQHELDWLIAELTQGSPHVTQKCRDATLILGLVEQSPEERRAAMMDFQEKLRTTNIFEDNVQSEQRKAGI